MKDILPFFMLEDLQIEGINELFQAIPKILDKTSNVRFILIGGIPYRDKNLVRQWWLPNVFKKYDDRIIFTGWIPHKDIINWYHIADIQVVPILYEPLGLVVLEGMRHGLPIIASNIGGPSEILRHQETGVLIPPRDNENLVKSFMWLINNKDLRKKMGIAALKEVKDNWLWPNIQKKVQNIYEELSY
jgi:glycosyltransferase involved in cell wall biosynthesis